MRSVFPTSVWERRLGWDRAGLGMSASRRLGANAGGSRELPSLFSFYLGASVDPRFDAYWSRYRGGEALGRSREPPAWQVVRPHRAVDQNVARVV